MSFELARERHGGVQVLALSGRLDNDNAADFELVVQEVLTSGERHLVLDLASLDYVSNAGLRALGRLAKSLNTPTTSLRVAAANGQLRQTFEAAGVAVLFDFHADREQALASHPAAGGGQLAEAMARLLCVADAPPAPAADPGITRLAELALELLGSRGRQTRAVRALAQGTQVMQRVTAQPAAASATASRKPGFWQRLFGRGKR